MSFKHSIKQNEILDEIIAKHTKVQKN